MLACFEINAVGPLLLTQALLPMLRLSAQQPRKLLIVTSEMGSLGNVLQPNRAGNVSYRSSKAAANMVGRCVAAELGTTEQLAVTLVHPGWCQTDMGTAGVPGRVPPVTPTESVAGMLKVMDGIEKACGSANFVDYTGAAIAW